MWAVRDAATDRTVPRSPRTGDYSSDVYDRALAWLLAKGCSPAEAEAVLAIFTPVEEDSDETEAVFLATPASSASK